MGKAEKIMEKQREIITSAGMDVEDVLNALRPALEIKKEISRALLRYNTKSDRDEYLILLNWYNKHIFQVLGIPTTLIDKQ